MKFKAVLKVSLKTQQTRLRGFLMVRVHPLFQTYKSVFEDTNQTRNNNLK